MIRCDCGAELANRGCLRNHESAGCLGATPTLEDLYRVGRVEVMPSGCHEWRRAMDGEYGWRTRWRGGRHSGGWPKGVSRSNP